jgi:hypothetical protein
MLVLPNNDIRLGCIFHIQPSVLEALVSVFLCLEHALPPAEMRRFVEFIFGGHALELSERHYSLRAALPHILLHFLHDNLPFLIDRFYVLDEYGCFILVELHGLLELLLFMEEVRHLHHVVHLAIVTQAKSYVHQLVLVLVDHTCQGMVLIWGFLTNAFDVLPQSCLEFSNVIMRRQTPDFYAKVFRCNLCVIYLLCCDLLHVFQHGKHHKHDYGSEEIQEHHHKRDGFLLHLNRFTVE